MPQRICWDAGLARVLVSNLAARGELRGAASSPLLIRWLCLCLGRLVQDNPLVCPAFVGSFGATVWGCLPAVVRIIFAGSGLPYLVAHPSMWCHVLREAPLAFPTSAILF